MTVPEVERNAESARTTYGLQGIKSGTFPPPTIYNWVRWKTVSTDALIAELRYWADTMESLAAQSDGSQDDHFCAHCPHDWDGKGEG